MLSLYDKQEKGEQYTKQRARNHIRQFEALASCYDSFKKIPEPALVNVRVRDDAYILGIELDELLSYLISKRDVPEALFQECARWDGMNDKIALISKAGAKTYFLSPIQYYNRDALSKWIHNPETYYMDTYMRNGFSLKSTSRIQIVTSKPKKVSVKVCSCLLMSLLNLC